MDSLICIRLLVTITVLTGFLGSMSANAQHPDSWLERLGILSSEPIQEFHEDFADLAHAHLDHGPLQPFVPKSVRNAYVYSSVYSVQLIAEYSFDKSDWAFLQEEWEELVDPSDIDHLRSVFRTCPWKRPLPEKGRYFKSVKEKMWDISGYVMINEDSLEAWYYWSVPQPARGSFCTQ